MRERIPRDDPAQHQAARRRQREPFGFRVLLDIQSRELPRKRDQFLAKPTWPVRAAEINWLREFEHVTQAVKVTLGHTQ
jgi:hypothetical protein